MALLMATTWVFILCAVSLQQQSRADFQLLSTCDAEGIADGDADELSKDNDSDLPLALYNERWEFLFNNLLAGAVCFFFKLPDACDNRATLFLLHRNIRI